MRKHFWIPITLGLAAYVLLPLPGQSAPLSERIESKRDQIQQKDRRAGVLTDTISGLNSRISGLEGEIDSTEQRLGTVERELSARREELLRVRDRLEVARDKLARARSRLEEGREALAERLVELYKADRPDALTVVLEADGFSDLLDRTEFLERISDQDREVVTYVRDLKRRFEREERTLASLEQEKEEIAVAVLRQRDEIAATRDRLASAQGELRFARNDRSQTLAKVRSSKSELEGDLRVLEAAQARVTGQLQGMAPAGPIKHGSGQLIWPVSGPVVSPFGMRWGRLHAGVDIAVPAGTPIRAADGGTVVLLGWVGGYGNYTCIQHTGSLSTCYAHQSSFATSQGASVQQGQVIGYIGCTGHCYGDHLHFETRVNGSPVDPLGYL
ncbi:MAG: peptidoglycan DD-metalloendopeptidase family protein [Thermoleophilaceae bacterium]